MVELIPASPAHICRIANRMRAADIEEVGAFGRSPKAALRIGLRASVDTFTVMIDGRPEGMMGLAPANALEREGTPWMLGTDELYRHPRAMLALGPKVLRIWGDSTRRMSNLVSKSNARAIRMLRRWQFQIGENVTVIGGVDFVTFSMVA